MNKRQIGLITITVILTAFFAFLGFFVFRSSYMRFGETLCNLWNSVKFYFCRILKINSDVMPTVENHSDILDFDNNIPAEFDGFKAIVKNYFALFFNSGNFKDWCIVFLHGIEIVGETAVIIFPILLLLRLALKFLYRNENNNYNKDTLPLKLFKKLSLVTYQPVKRIALSYAKFVKDNSVIWAVWLAIWAFNLNLVSIVTEFLAYYLYFAVSYRFDTLYVQFVKLLIDLQIIFRNVPWWILIPVAWFIFEYIRRKAAITKLRRYERRNCGFINELPIVSMTCGSMGKKKTTAVTDMALSQEVMFRRKAYELLQKNDMKFAFFPWISLEKELQTCMRYKTVCKRICV